MDKDERCRYKHLGYTVREQGERRRRKLPCGAGTLPSYEMSDGGTHSKEENKSFILLNHRLRWSSARQSHTKYQRHDEGMPGEEF